MHLFITRYGIPYAISVAIMFAVWLISIWVLDGLIPTIAFLLLCGVSIFGIPYLIYQDFKSAKAFLVDASKNIGSADRSKLVDLFAESLKVSPDLASKILDRVKK